jgi:hypothetical protein
MRIPRTVIVIGLFLLGFTLAKTSAEPYISHLITRVVNAARHF